MSNKKAVEPKSAIKSIECYEVPMYPEEYKLKLDANENIFGCSTKVCEAIKNISKEKILTYPHYGRLTEEIAKYTKTEAEWIKVTNGADEALYSLMQAYLSEKDEMITVKPSFSMPKIYAEIAGAKVVEIEYKKRWKFPIEEFIKELESNKKIKIVHLTSPNNPTGECITRVNAEKIIKAAKNKLVIFDETYAGYCSESMISEVRKYDNIAIVKSLSKDFALAGLRIGYIITNPERIKILKRVISPYSVNIAAAVGAEAALKDIKHIEKIKTEIEKSKEILTNGLKKLKFEVYPSEANFILFNAGEKAEYVYHTLLKHGIKVRRFSDEGMKDLIRITAPDTKSAKKIISLIQPKPTLIFDMDGVLADVSNSYRTTIKKTYEHFAKKEISYKEISDAKNLGGLNNDWDLTEYLLLKEGIKVNRGELIKFFEEIYFKKGKGLINEEKFLFRVEIIKELAKKYNLAIFTGRPREEAIYTLKKENAEQYFYPIITMDDIPEGRQKPDKYGIEKIKEKVLYKEVYYFGDTKDDIICGNRAKVHSIGILAPQSQNEEERRYLTDNGAEKVLTSINEITKIIESETNEEVQKKQGNKRNRYTNRNKP